MTISERLIHAQKVLATQPFSKLLGTEITEFLPERTELQLAVRDDLRQQHGFVHGGVISYLADNALTFAGGASLDGQIVTAEMKINYIRPAIGELLIARASAIASGKTQAVARCEIYAVSGGEEKLCAAAQGTIAVIPPREA
jgi:uncharacterized protein (TIGR00369 family)